MRATWLVVAIALVPWLSGPLANAQTTAKAGTAETKAEDAKTAGARATDARVAIAGLPTLAPVLDKVLPSVVAIAVRGRAPETEGGEGAPGARGERQAIPPELLPEREFHAVGSGVVVDAAAGLVITNNHVIEKASEITVILNGGGMLPATKVGSDPETDIGVLRVAPGDGLTALAFGDSDTLKVGDYVLAVGNPYGLRQTATLGIVSALARSGLGIESYENFIQTDAPINPGNSGGALVNLRGELVGINTAILGPSGGSVGIGFAIPISMARVVMHQLVDHGVVRRGRIGVSVQDLAPKLAKVFEIKAEHGVLVTDVADGGPAAAAGVEIGDALLKIDGQPILGTNDLRRQIALLPAGRKLSVDAVRDGKPLTLTITTTSSLPTVLPAPVGNLLEGVVLGAIGPETPAPGGRGVVVISAGSDSVAHRTGLRSGDIILAVGHELIGSLDDLIKATQPAKRRPEILFVRRNKANLFVVAE